MLKKTYVTILMLLACSLFAQSNTWNPVWSMGQLPFQDPGVGSNLAIIKAGFDSDKDGKGEFLIAYTEYDSNYVIMYEAQGDNDYQLVWYWKVPIQTNSFIAITIGDLDGNGKDEIVAGLPAVTDTERPNPDRLYVFEWNGTVGENAYGNFDGTAYQPHSSFNCELPDLTDFRPYSMQIEDIDNDGTNELIMGIRQGGRGREIMVLSLTGEFVGFGTWVIEYNLTGLSGGALYSVTTGDLDNDGKKEIYGLLWNMFSLYIVEATGPNQYEYVKDMTAVMSAGGIDYGSLEGVRVADVNNDGVNEMYIACTEPNNAIFVVSNIADISFLTVDDIKPLMKIERKAGGKLRTLYVTDPDKDGKMDLMIGGEANGRIFDLEYKGTGAPTDSASWEINVAFDLFQYAGFDPAASPTISPRFFYGYPANDMDGDGKNEYCFINYSTDFDVWTEDKYIWIIEAEPGTGVEDNAILPTTNYLAQNYPNPFNPNTTISFNILTAGQVNLTVYDMLGREVAVLVNDMLTAGTHHVNFDASKLTSGVYMYKITSGSFQQTKKMMLVK
ncbi:MAG TPA: T9SS type A sorting domain-containing protein [Melioribacteraceae bacterium]|nr:T9SS type A sorting domain-containing protein [Melioribacteraceae bacterium]